MKKFLFIIIIAVITLPLTGCLSDIGKVSLGEDFELKMGESTAVRGEDFNIKFLEVLEDSRCPRNVTCVWEGRARSLVRITIDGQSEDIELAQPGLTDEPNRYSYGDYIITFFLLPYPEEAGGALEYYLLLQVSPI